MAQTNKFATEAYSVSIVGKHIQITDTIKDYIFEKISKFERFTNKILDIAVTIDVQKLEHSAVFLMKFLHFQIKSHASTEDLYSAIDKASDRMLRLISKYKNKLMDHHAIGLSSIDLNVNVLQPQRDELKEINTEIDAENWARDQERFKIHKIVATDKIAVRMLKQDEAVMKMELSSDPFLIYRCEEDQKLKVIYRREDQNYGVVEIHS
jgi:putative sigma-54 modulation protein